MAGFQLVLRPAVKIIIAVDELEELLLLSLWLVARKVKEDSTTGESKFCPWLVLFQLCHIDALLVLKAISHRLIDKDRRSAIALLSLKDSSMPLTSLPKRPEKSSI